MNFQELMARMAELDKPVVETDKGDMDKDGKDEADNQEYLDNKDAAIKKAMGNDETKESLDELASEVQQEVDECGMDQMGMSSPMSKQQDNVSMNINMTGSGSGGIRDLMNILRDIENGDDDHNHDDGIDLKPSPTLIPDKMPMIGDEYNNSPDPITMGTDAVTFSGNDLHKAKDSFSDKPYRGDNPMAVEGIKNKLATMYERYKSE